MELAPKLIDVAMPHQPDGAVLVLHGGASRRSQMMVSPTQLSVLRMIPIARKVARATDGRVAVYRLLNTHRGWDTSHTPVDDARWALSQIAEHHGRIPVSLVGHSLGGRAALLTAADPLVRSAVALAPWVYPTDVPRGDLSGRRILIVHGTADRIASPQRSAALAAALSLRTDVSYLTVEGGKHAMLRHHKRFDGLAADFVAHTLLDAPVPEALTAA